MTKLTRASKLRDIFAHPLGRDIVDKLLQQMNVAARLVYNPIVRNLRIRTVERLAKKHVDSGFFDVLLNLLNMHTDRPRTDAVPNAPAWWKEAVFYQIYPRSFGGGLPGIIDKLDYLHDLGIDALWLSPVYDSPNDDNGYDIRDYYKILPEFGTMDDMKALIQGLHERGMKLVMDLVVNHTSDEHAWFAQALADKNSPLRDYYFFRDGTDADKPPNNWKSFFGGSAWRHFPEQGVWALCLFSKKQMDLNWENADMRSEICRMINFWLDMGVDGFRMDVINYISKTPGLPQGNEFIGSLMKYTGIEHYFCGPDLHEHLRQIHREAFLPHKAFSVGEVPGIGLRAGRLLTDGYRGELDLIFNFDHLETPGHARFDVYTYDARFLKQYYTSRLNADMGHGWHTLFFNNHDNPKMTSKVDPQGLHTAAIAKMLCVLSMTLRGTPFVYQGDEIGAGNLKFSSIDELRDVESHGMYRDFVADGMDAAAAAARVFAGTRDHARAPMDWQTIASQQADSASVLQFYKQLIAWRKDAGIVYAPLVFLRPREKNALRYMRAGKVCAYVEVNLSTERVKSRAPKGFGLIFSSGGNDGVLGAYEARVYGG